MMPNSFLVMAIIAAPFALLMAVGLVKVRRQRLQFEEGAARPEPPFEPEAPKPRPAWAEAMTPAEWLSVKEIPQLFRALFLIDGWAFFVICSFGMLPQAIAKTPGGIIEIRVWESYLNHFASGTLVFGIIGFFAAFGAAVHNIVPAQAQFNRTRPVARSFLYWSRVLPVLAATLGALLVGAALSFVLLLALHGPVWEHAFDGPTRGAMAAPLYLTLSSVTHLALIYSAATVLFNVLPRSPRLKIGYAILAWLAIVGYWVFGIAAGIEYPRLSVLYQDLGPARPLAFALVPIALSVGLLWLGHVLSDRLET